MNSKEFNWTTPDGIIIQGYHWDTFHAKAVIALVHGLGEHAGRYTHFARYFSTHGFATIAYDRRGHGRSGGKRGHTPSYEAYQQEVNYLLAYTREQYPTVPVFLYGHSMGGNLVLFNVLRYHPDIQGVVASAPWIELTERPPLAKVIAGRLTSRVFPSITLPNGLDPRDLSRDTSVVEAYIKDPLVHDMISSAAGTAMLDAGKWLSEYSGESPLPILIIHGTEDRLTSPVASQAFAGRVKGDITFMGWEGAYHELHNEPNQKEIMEACRHWMEDHMDTRPGGPVS